MFPLKMSIPLHFNAELIILKRQITYLLSLNFPDLKNINEL